MAPGLPAHRLDEGLHPRLELPRAARYVLALELEEGDALLAQVHRHHELLDLPHVAEHHLLADDSTAADLASQPDRVVATLLLGVDHARAARPVDEVVLGEGAHGVAARLVDLALEEPAAEA